MKKRVVLAGNEKLIEQAIEIVEREFEFVKGSTLEITDASLLEHIVDKLKSLLVEVGHEQQ